MSFGRKGLAPGSAAVAPAPGGFGRAKPADPRIGAASAAPSGGLSLEKKLDPDELAAKREAFIASERARRAQEEGLDPAPAANDPMSGLHNSSRPAARPAQPFGTGPVGENGLTEEQEKQIRETARSMAEGRRSRTSAAPPAAEGGLSGSGFGSGGGGSSRSSRGSGNSDGSIFGDPRKRSLIVAYLLWFVFGQLAMHRFYCGQKNTAIMQISLFVGSVILAFILPILLSGSLPGLGLGFLFQIAGGVGFLGWMIWVVADLFLMPGMLKSLRARHDFHEAFR